MPRVNKFSPGDKFHRLEIIERGNLVDGVWTWFCKCRCGTPRIEVIGTYLKRGRVKSCGCLHREQSAALCRSRATHGKTGSPEYRLYHAMLERCGNEKYWAYTRYGGRGVKVCPRWLGEDGFPNFFSDMGERPSPEHSLDRFPNKDGDYAPNNCRWATRIEQANNKCNNRILTYNGESLTVAQWGEKLGVDPDSFRSRINRGWSVERAVETPYRKIRWQSKRLKESMIES